ncbi:hypothetical protein [Halalkaliarchaeum desulfuricum]|nr:hypothetical protein [Halalkaliarchaeum desulfuricum]
MTSIRVWAVAGIAVLAVVGIGVIAAADGGAAQDDVVALTVTVEDRDGNPVGGADLTATWEDGETTATTASNGRAFVDVQRGADVEIEVEHDEYVRNTPLLVENATERDVTVDVARQGGIVVTTTHDGTPVDNVSVTVRKDRVRIVDGETTAAGEFDSGVIEQGEYTVSVVKQGYFQQTHEITVDGDVTHEFELRRGSVLLSIQLADDYYEEPRPIEGAQIDVEDIGTVTTLSDGEATVRVPVNAWLAVTADREGYSPTSQSVRIREVNRNVTMMTNREPTLTVEPSNERIVSGERLTVTVLDEYEDPAEGATIRVDGQDVGETVDDGTATFRLEGPSQREIVAVRDGIESEPVTVRVVADETPTPTPTATPTPTETPTPEPTPTEAEGAGFGVAIGIAALVASLLVLRRFDD